MRVKQFLWIVLESLEYKCEIHNTTTSQVFKKNMLKLNCSTILHHEIIYIISYFIKGYNFVRKIEPFPNSV